DVVNDVTVNTPLLITACPSIVSDLTPSGDEIVNVPGCVRLSLLVSEPADPPAPRLASRSSSFPVTSPPPAAGVRFVIVGGELPIEIVSVVCDRSPSPSLIV